MAYKYVEINDKGDLKQLLIGSYLGDGSFTKISGGAKNSRFSLAHSIKQKDYVIRKWNVFNKYGIAGALSENIIEGERYLNGYFEEIRFKSKAHPLFTWYRENGYNETKKKLNIEIVKDIAPLGLAIWFMDDGNRTNDGCDINCQKFSEEEKHELKDLLFRKFNLIVNVTKGTLYISKNNLPHFTSIINNYMLESLKYKLNPYKGSV